MSGQPRSRWLFLSISLVTALGCTGLGVWQLRRLTDRRVANAVAERSRRNAPREFPAGGPVAEDIRVVATGTYDTAHEFVIRGRAFNGAPGVEIATPLRIAGSDTALIILRGFVPSDDATSVDRAAIAEPGVRTVRGVGFLMTGTGIPMARHGGTTWDRLPGTAMPTLLPYPVSPYALWQEKDSGMTGFPIRLGVPALSEGPHLSYAIQWFAFAVIFGFGGVYYAFGTREERGETRDGV